MNDRIIDLTFDIVFAVIVLGLLGYLAHRYLHDFLESDEDEDAEQEEVSRLHQEIGHLETLLAGAPHGNYCWSHTRETGRGGGDCNCWKSQITEHADWCYLGVCTKP